jgi:protease YdgD
MLRSVFLTAGLTVLLAAVAPGPLSVPALAFDAPKGSRLDSALYKPSAELVRSLLSDEHIKSKIDGEGDLEVTFHGNDVPLEGWVVFDKLDDGTIWNLRFTAPVPSSEIRGIDREGLLRFANNWNRDEIAVKLYVDDDGNLQTEHDLNVQFGVNPQEFQENGIRIYESALGRVVDGLAEARGSDSNSDDSGSSNSSSGSVPEPKPDTGSANSGATGNQQPQKSMIQPDEGDGI